MINSNLSMELEGTLKMAFELFCKNNGITNTREGIRAVIMTLPEYRQVRAAMGLMGKLDCGEENELDSKSNLS
jgi:hypothetical protein